MRRTATIALLCATALLALGVAPAWGADFGLKGLEFGFSEGENGVVARQAGSHPFEVVTNFGITTEASSAGPYQVPTGDAHELVVELPPGLTGDPRATPQCSNVDFLSNNLPAGAGNKELSSLCPDATAVGVGAITADVGRTQDPSEGGTTIFGAAVYNLNPPSGVLARLGFYVEAVPVTVDVGLSESAPYRVVARVTNVPQPIRFFASRLVLWGNPADPAHDPYRGSCTPVGATGTLSSPEAFKSRGDCPTSSAERPFLLLPRSCQGPLETNFTADSWQHRGDRVRGTASTPGMLGCEDLGLDPDISSEPTTGSASSGSGLDFELRLDDGGIRDPQARSESDVKAAEIVLPEGVTLNPSQAEGLGVCTESELRDEQVDSAAGGCPDSSKVGNLEVETPLLENELLRGSVYLAEPNENRFGSLVALYMVIRDPELGILVKLAGEVDLDSNTGQVTTTFDDLPQIPFSRFHVRLHGGPRSPLVTPERCGSYTTTARLTPWADPASEVTETTSFHVGSGVDGGSCPSGSKPFDPELTAGSDSNASGQFSPYRLRITRDDGEQELTRLDAVLPPGVVPKLAGVEQCSDGAIAAARGRNGRDELNSPSCPSGSQIGTTDAGAGVGSELTYVPGKLYLAGPFAGDPLSVVAITPAVAGPFDVGTVVIREGISLSSDTYRGMVDGAGARSIPHILEGIPLRLRDLRVDVARQDFMRNPTSCRVLSTDARIWGGGENDRAGNDDDAISRSERYQAAGCSRLGFRPRMAVRLFGGVRRGGFPALRAAYVPRKGAEANLRRLAFILPSSEYIEQGHFRTICTRVQFAAKGCPKGSIYGRVVAFSPLLDRPLRGPVYLRSSDNVLPDAIFDLHGIIDIEVALKVDSAKGRFRATVGKAPDVPISRVVVQMQGGQKGLFVNSRNICADKNRVTVRALGHNGRRHVINPAVRAMACVRKARRNKRGKAKGRRARRAQSRHRAQRTHTLAQRRRAG